MHQSNTTRESSKRKRIENSQNQSNTLKTKIICKNKKPPEGGFDLFLSRGKKSIHFFGLLLKQVGNIK